MTAYTNQYTAIKTAIGFVERDAKRLDISQDATIECLRDAATTIAALNLIGDKRILILEDLIKLAQEFVADRPSMDLGEVMNYQQDFKKLLEKIK